MTDEDRRDAYRHDIFRRLERLEAGPDTPANFVAAICLLSRVLLLSLDSGSADRKLDRILALVEALTVDEKDLQRDLDAIKDGVARQAAAIAELKTQLANGTPVTQEQLDALDAEAQGIVAILAPPPTV